MFKHSGQSRAATPVRVAGADGSDWQPTEAELQEQFEELDGCYGHVEYEPYDYEDYYNQNWQAIEEWNAWKADNPQ